MNKIKINNKTIIIKYNNKLLILNNIILISRIFLFNKVINNLKIISLFNKIINNLKIIIKMMFLISKTKSIKRKVKKRNKMSQNIKCFNLNLFLIAIMI